MSLPSESDIIRASNDEFSPVNQTEYLLRIGIKDISLATDATTLKRLQRQHLLTVPFENLDIHWRRPIALDTSRFYQKIVKDKRGGFCYELNGLFNELLKSIGFQTRLVSARVGDGHGNFSQEYDHAAIIVTIDGVEYLADVGFGEFAAEPLRIVTDAEQRDDTGVYIFRVLDNGYLEVSKREGGGWRSEYAFMPEQRDLTEFETRCEFQQHSPDSHFLKGKICSLMTVNGRKTLTDKKFIVSANGKKVETDVTSEAEFDRILMREFSISRAK